MRKWVLVFVLFAFLAVPVGASAIEPVEPEGAVADRIPQSTGDFGKDLWYVIRSAILSLRPDLAQGMQVCLSVFAVAAGMALLRQQDGAGKAAVELSGVVAISCILLRAADTMIRLGVNTVAEISHYGTMLLPVMAAALAAQGGVTSAGALFAGTAIFDTVRTSLVARCLVPMV